MDTWKIISFLVLDVFFKSKVSVPGTLSHSKYYGWISFIKLPPSLGLVVRCWIYESFNEERKEVILEERMDWGALLYFEGKLGGHLVFCIEPVRILCRERGERNTVRKGGRRNRFDPILFLTRVGYQGEGLWIHWMRCWTMKTLCGALETKVRWLSTAEAFYLLF